MSNIVIIGAHSDDAEISMGGTIAKWSKKYNIYLVITSKSNYSSYEGNSMRTEEQVRLEQNKASKVLGIHKTIFLNFKTKQVPYNKIIIEQLNKILDQLKPKFIFTHCIEDKHQDHANTAKAVISASRYFNNVYMFEPIFPSNLYTMYKPMIYSDITNYFDIKIKSIQAHKSQYKQKTHWYNTLKSLGQLRGAEINTEYAESFMPIKGTLNI